MTAAIQPSLTNVHVQSRAESPTHPSTSPPLGVSRSQVTPKALCTKTKAPWESCQTILTSRAQKLIFFFLIYSLLHSGPLWLGPDTMSWEQRGSLSPIHISSSSSSRATLLPHSGSPRLAMALRGTLSWPSKDTAALLKPSHPPPSYRRSVLLPSKST